MRVRDGIARAKTSTSDDQWTRSHLSFDRHKRDVLGGSRSRRGGDRHSRDVLGVSRSTIGDRESTIQLGHVKTTNTEIKSAPPEIRSTTLTRNIPFILSPRVIILKVINLSVFANELSVFAKSIVSVVSIAKAPLCLRKPSIITSKVYHTLYHPSHLWSLCLSFNLPEPRLKSLMDSRGTQILPFGVSTTVFYNNISMFKFLNKKSKNDKFICGSQFTFIIKINLYLLKTKISYINHYI